MKTVLTSLTTAAALAISTLAASAETWDMSLPWPDGNFHSQNAYKFAEAVSEATEGRVTINVHPGGSLGFSGPEMLGAIRDGLVPIGDVYLSQQVGEAPLLGIESIPFLVTSYEELAELHEHFRPVVEQVAAENNQMVLYMVPWPAPGIFSSVEADSLDDLAGIKIRTYNATTTELFNAIGMTAVQLPWGEVVPSLAAGTIDGVTTSASSGVDGAFWEFLDYFYPTGHVWSSDAITVNLDAWAALSEDDQNAIMAVAQELEPTFWAASKSEDAAKMATLAENGLETAEVTADMIAAMKEATATMIDDYLEANPDAKPVLDAFFAETAN